MLSPRFLERRWVRLSRATILAPRRQGPTGPLLAVDRAAVENDLEQAGGRSLAALAAATSKKTAEKNSRSDDSTAFAFEYGKRRLFHAPLGHDA